MIKVDLPIGTLFYVDGDLLTVKKLGLFDCNPTPCSKCYFFKVGRICTCMLSCTDTNRRDGVDVIFKKVEEKQ